MNSSSLKIYYSPKGVINKNKKDMKLNNIKIRNFRGCQDVQLDFDKNMTVIVGANGSGKSSILDAISISLSWIIARVRNIKAQGLFIADEEIYNGSKAGYIDAQFDGIEKLLIPSKTQKGFSKEYTSDLKDLNRFCDSIREKIELTEKKTSLPILVKYGVRRAVVDIPLRTPKSHDFDLFEAYENSLRGDANFRSFFEWYRIQEDIENEKLRESYDLFNSGNPESFQPDKTLEAIRRAIRKFMPAFDEIRVTRKPLQMRIKKNGFSLNVSQLSDGEKIYMALVGDLCRRLTLANPTLDDPLQGEGIVLIDELDLHLHPQWQTEIATKLCETFPNIQFIVTTHSPLVITNVQSSQLRILSSTDGDVKVLRSAGSYALPVSVILKDVMGITNELPYAIEKVLLPDLYKSIHDGDIDKAKKMCSELESLSPDFPDLVKIRKFIEIKSCSLQ